jgi:hypothetical protein
LKVRCDCGRQWDEHDHRTGDTQEQAAALDRAVRLKIAYAWVEEAEESSRGHRAERVPAEIVEGRVAPGQQLQQLDRCAEQHCDSRCE